MRRDLRNRRKQLLRQLVVSDADEATVVEDVADDHDVSVETVRRDLDTLDDWYEELPRATSDPAIMLFGIWNNRARLSTMADEAQENGDYREARLLRQTVNQTFSEERRCRELLGTDETGAERHDREAALETDDYSIIPDDVEGYSEAEIEEVLGTEALEQLEEEAAGGSYPTAFE